MNIDENVPTIIPIKNTSAKSTITPDPNKYNDNAANNVDVLVKIVRERVRVIDKFIMSRKDFEECDRNSSLIRSKTIMVSLMEYPTTINTAATIADDICFPSAK